MGGNEVDTPSNLLFWVEFVDCGPVTIFSLLGSRRGGGGEGVKGG